MSFLLELREKARNCHDTKIKAAIVEAADTLAAAIEAFYKDRDYGSMTQLNNAWVRAHRIKLTAPGPFSPQAGGMPLTDLQKAA